MSVTTTTKDLMDLAGQELGVSDWLEITQDQINTFGANTGDQQWIHVDVERARAESPFGGPIAHGYLTLSLLVPMWKQLLVVTDAAISVNYGLDRVRFPAPLPVDSRVHLTGRITQVQAVSGGGVQITGDAVMERESGDKPVCVAEPVFRFYP